MKNINYNIIINKILEEKSSEVYVLETHTDENNDYNENITNIAMPIC